MSLRTLPDITVAAPKADLAFDVAPQALAAWDANVTAEAGDGVISILDVIGEDFFGEGVTSKSVSASLSALGGKPVTVLINSPGGNFFEGLAIYNLLRSHPAEVTVRIVGIAASAASIIAMAGDRVEIARAGLMMIHNTQWVAVGDRHAMQEAADTMAVFDEAMTGLYVDRTEIADAEIARMMDATTFMSSAKAIEDGFADDYLDADQVRTGVRAQTEKPPAYRVEAALARHGVPRAERRKLLKELTAGMPSAAPETAMPSAGDTAVDDGTAGLNLALARLKLARA